MGPTRRDRGDGNGIDDGRNTPHGVGGFRRRRHLRLDGAARRLAGGQTHNCEILDDGSLTCWGSGLGVLGYGNTDAIGDDELPADATNGGLVQLPGGEAAVAVDAGIGFTCVLLASGGVTCFGKGFNGELGYGVGSIVIGDDETPADNPANGGYVPLPDDEPAVAIATGDSHTCALLSSGRVTCWGSSAHGQLGYGLFIDVGFTTTPADAGVVALPGNERAIAISAGGDTTLCHPHHSRGRLLGRSTHGASSATPTPPTIGDNETPADNVVNGGVVALPGGLGATAIDVGYLHVCAILTDGTVTCWGAGNDTQLGYGNQFDIGDNETPATNPVDGGIVQLPYGQPALAISSGHGHTCAILVPNGLACWGNNGNGQLGYGNTNILGITDKPISNPVNSGYVPLPGGQQAVAVSANDTYTCAILDGGQTTCWGLNAGQLGYGNIGNAFDIGDDELIGANPVNGGFVRLPGPGRRRAGRHRLLALVRAARQRPRHVLGFGGDGELGTGSIADDRRRRDRSARARATAATSACPATSGRCRRRRRLPHLRAAGERRDQLLGVRRRRRTRLRQHQQHRRQRNPSRRTRRTAASCCCPAATPQSRSPPARCTPAPSSTTAAVSCWGDERRGRSRLRQH